MTAVLMIFRRFQTTFRRLSKIVLKARRTFPNIFREFPKIPKDVRRLPKTIEEDPNMFWWYTNYFLKYNLRDKLDNHISEIIDIFTCEDIVSFLWICYHSVYHWLLYNETNFRACYSGKFILWLWYSPKNHSRTTTSPLPKQIFYSACVTESAKPEAIGHNFLCALIDCYCWFIDSSRQAWFSLRALHLARWLLQFQNLPQHEESRDEVYLHLQDSRWRVWASGMHDLSLLLPV